MVNYRRSQTPGGTFFFTVNLRDRSANHLITHIHQLRNCIRSVKQQRPFEIIALVVLPDHLHAVFRLPKNDHDFPGRWKLIKSRFSRALIKEGVVLKKNEKGEINLWQRRYWEHQIRNEADLQTHVDYIHFNPVKHGYVERATDWPHSSFHRFVRLGMLDKHWGCPRTGTAGGGFGE